MVQPNAILRANSSGITWYPPDHHNFQLADRLAELRKSSGAIFAVTVFGAGGRKYTGFAHTARDAYRDADHNRRRARHTIEGLLRKRRKSVRRELDYRAKLKLAGHCLDMTCVNYETELSALRDEKADLQDELAVTERNRAAAVAAKLDAEARIRSLESNGNEKDKGMALVRQALEEAGITQGNLIERVKQLAKERDEYRLAAQQNAAATV